jgi:hypothetical protein
MPIWVSRRRALFRAAMQPPAFAHHLRDLADTLFTGENVSFVAQ